MSASVDMCRKPSECEQWGHFADEQQWDDAMVSGPRWWDASTAAGASLAASNSSPEDAPTSCSSSRDASEDGVFFDGANGSSSGSSSADSTAGLSELNLWLHESCEVGMGAWMRAGPDAKGPGGRRRCYFTTGGSPTPRRHRRGCDGPASVAGGAGPHYFSEDDRRPRRAHADPVAQADWRRLPQQLWCVTPFENRCVSRWERLETALTPQLCPRVISREFPGGVIVGVSLGSIRVLSNVMQPLGGCRCEYLLMLSIGDRCRRAWRREAHFAQHAKRHWDAWAPQCRAVWLAAEAEKRWFDSAACGDYPYIATRHAVLEALVREVLYGAASPDELLELAGAQVDDLPQLRALRPQPCFPADHDDAASAALVDASCASSADDPSRPTTPVAWSAADEALSESLLFGTVELEAADSACLPVAKHHVVVLGATATSSFSARGGSAASLTAPPRGGGASLLACFSGDKGRRHDHHHMASNDPASHEEPPLTAALKGASSLGETAASHPEPGTKRQAALNNDRYRYPILEAATRPINIVA